MSFKKYALLAFLIFLTIQAFSKKTDSFFLKWKIKPGEIIAYKTTFDEIDTAHHKNFSFNGFTKSLGHNSDTADFQKMFKELKKIDAQSSYITYLKENRKNIIDIDMQLKYVAAKTTTDTDKTAKALSDMMAMQSKMNNGIVLRGAVHEDGTLESFYTKNEQKNLISIFFELPGKPIKLGDQWALNINFLSMDQNFTCDSSYKKNEVTVVHIDNNGGEHIVTLQYDIEEYVTGNFSSPFDNKPVKTSMKMTHKALAEFSVEKGRWITYNGIMSLTATGIMSSQSTKKCSLVAE